MKTWFVIAAVLTTFPVAAQQAGNLHHSKGTVERHAREQPSPYAEFQSRQIKTLSQQQIDELTAGKGMALALAAELNGYPGPSHTLEFGDQLELSAEQRRRTEQLFKQMKEEAKALGHLVIASEYELNALFRDRKATVEAIDETVKKAATLQGKLKNAHLVYHLKMQEELTPSQVARYNELRGYGTPAHSHQDH